MLQTYADEFGLLTQTQEGNRPHRGTKHALQYLTLPIEDAKTYKKDLFTVDIDWKNAFNSVDHGRLFIIMEMLGFPIDAIGAVRHTYKNAATRICTPHGLT